MASAADAERDQSYFLFDTTREQLDFLRFPLGDLPKPAVRQAATALGLAVADKPDSQDICFVPEGRYSTLIDKLRPHAAGAGEIVHLDGRILGAHDGVSRYTVGQRRGLKVAVGEPLFVVALEPALKRVVVGPREALLTAELVLKETNWLGEGATLVEAAARGLQVLAQVDRPARPWPAAWRCATDRPCSCSIAPRKASPPGRPASSMRRTLPHGSLGAASSPRPGEPSRRRLSHEAQ